jgi:hypothetical protein
MVMMKILFAAKIEDPDWAEQLITENEQDIPAASPEGGEIDWERELHYQELEWNAVSTWAKIKRWILWQYTRFQLWREKDEIPF